MDRGAYNNFVLLAHEMEEEKHCKLREKLTIIYSLSP